MRPRVLAINPGSTSTKVALFEGADLVRQRSLHHDVADLQSRLLDQLPMRKQRVRDFIEGETRLDAVVGRGGLLHPLRSGAYVVNDQMLSDLSHSRYGDHASNLGAFLASDIATRQGTRIPAIIVDPVVVDELIDVARFSGYPAASRRSIFHALNQKAIGRRISSHIGKEYARSRLVIAHMGGGITVGAHLNGQVVDVSNGIDGEGPMTPERSGALPVAPLVRMCFSGATKQEMQKRLVGKGGLFAYLGTNDFRDALKRIDEPEVCELVEAFSLQIAKEIGRAASVLDGQVDAIVLTGGLSHSEPFCQKIEAYVQKFAPVIRAPGEDEMLALAEGALRVLNGAETPHTYESLPQD